MPLFKDNHIEICFIIINSIVTIYIKAFIPYNLQIYEEADFINKNM